ncbi:hypothetical protein [Ruegeria arenilitoris]|uniref:hypothetical protein n=1 Tax=Ruegeria arenilitoris TaxID=1173585 RepID=UPI003C7ED048
MRVSTIEQPHNVSVDTDCRAVLMLHLSACAALAVMNGNVAETNTKDNKWDFTRMAPLLQNSLLTLLHYSLCFTFWYINCAILQP